MILLADIIVKLVSLALDVPSDNVSLDFCLMCYYIRCWKYTNSYYSTPNRWQKAIVKQLFTKMLVWFGSVNWLNFLISQKLS